MAAECRSYFFDITRLIPNPCSLLPLMKRIRSRSRSTDSWHDLVTAEYALKLLREQQPHKAIQSSKRGTFTRLISIPFTISDGSICSIFDSDHFSSSLKWKSLLDKTARSLF